VTLFRLPFVFSSTVLHEAGLLNDFSRNAVCSDNKTSTFDAVPTDLALTIGITFNTDNNLKSALL
jgi:hypothetical protein